MQIKHNIFLLILIILLPHIVFGDDQGEKIANQMQSSSISKTTSAAGNSLLADLGISVNPFGRPSSGQLDTMGVSGKSMSQFEFKIRPACNRDQTVFGLDGATITIPCQSSDGKQITFTVKLPCTESSKCDPFDIDVYLEGKAVTKNDFTWQASCDTQGHCHCTMSQETIVSGNADNLVTQGQKAQQNNDAYHAVYTNYIGKNGYSQTQSYMRSFGVDGKNKWLADCMQNMGNYTKDGIIYSCDGSQQADLYNQCKTVKECVKYDYKTVINEIKKNCNINAKEKTLICERSPEVKIQSIDFTYPNCKNLIITQGAYNHCPLGYTEELYSDMIQKVTWDDIRLCTKIVSANDPSNCYNNGYFIATRVKSFFGTGQGVVPKGLHAHLELSHVYFDQPQVTVIAKNTGKILKDHVVMGNTNIDLPFSYTEDQTFSFFLSGKPNLTAVLTLLIDHQGQYKTSSITMTQSCPSL